MLKRLNTPIYDVELILKFLHVILASLKIDDRFEKCTEKLKTSEI
ncbi:hypothetical protein Ferp_2164 [Ferroglobus placidus DSM 10642]|uniref:Uncharacterized protein n=1 Tax=Ferroglobus placidus (strain DSM 10642 / AEDII12DO) TaxID=589924 RepID=D3S0Q4_FERPA|nr:hypothetical protein [Ferroglobus placidus]ADC66295.1 hypothetical protein Ferp_2164 [Ferroglobus placidus DSM 10642]